MRLITRCVVLLTIGLSTSVAAQDIIPSRSLDAYIKSLRHVPSDLELEMNYSLRAGYLPVGLPTPSTVYNRGSGFRASIARRETELTVQGNIGRGWSLDSTLVGDCQVKKPLRLGVTFSYSHIRRDDPIFQTDDFSVSIRKKADLYVIGVGGGFGNLTENNLRIWGTAGYYYGRYIAMTSLGGGVSESETSVLADDGHTHFIGGMARWKASFGHRFNIEIKIGYFKSFIDQPSLALPPQELSGTARMSLRIIGPVWMTAGANGYTDKRFLKDDRRFTIGFKLRRFK